MKYRIWDSYQKAYIATGIILNGEISAVICGASSQFSELSDMLEDTMEARLEASGYECVDDILGDFVYEQCTGLTDANGIDIYEGDRMHNIFYPEIDYRYEVSGAIFHEFAIDAYHNRKCNDIIVGTIHD